MLRLLLLLPLLLAGCQLGPGGPAEVAYPADPEAGEIAIRFEGPGEAALVVPVEVNGQGPYAFVLDTGATFTCVAEPLAEALGLPVQRGVAGLGAGVGGTGQLRMVRMDSLRVGGALAAGVTACVLDLAHLGSMGVEVDGLLGLNVLRSFRVTLDFGRNVLRLEVPE